MNIHIFFRNGNHQIRTAILFVIIHSITIKNVIGMNKTKDMIQKMRQKAMYHLTPTSRSESKMSFANCTCHFFTQPLDHFAIGTHTDSKQFNMTLNQRYCIYDGYDEQDHNNPIFFYTGNESPVETYANHTGLMWTLASKYKALIVFAEHRYEGLSLPSIFNHSNTSLDDFPNCLSYASSSQALADYSQLLSFLNPNHIRPVIVFGGSYGGMLSAWMRMKYPTSVAGAIASSAPIWGTPLTRPKIDSANIAISRGILLSDLEDENGHCFDNLLAVWPLMLHFSQSIYGRSILNQAFRLCPHDHLKKDNDIHKLMSWAKSPWFPLAEGNYPFESNYITFALLKKEQIQLPKWPITEACHRGKLNQYKNIQIVKKGKDVFFDVVVKNDDKELLRLNIDWDEMTVQNNDFHLQEIAKTGVTSLFESLREAVGVWFNVTNDKQCFSLDPAISSTSPIIPKSTSSLRHLNSFFFPIPPNNHESCLSKIMKEGSWSSLCCNENLNLPIMIAEGMGNDFFWPPSAPRNTTLADLLSQMDNNSQDDVECSDPTGTYGYPQKLDPWSHWIDDYYGGLRIGKHSNIAFSHGLLDPWSGGGVYPGNPPPPGIYDGDIKKNINKDGSLISLMIAKGGHHLDLFYETDDDPECVKEVRQIQDELIGKWIDEWRFQICVGDVCEVR